MNIKNVKIAVGTGIAATACSLFAGVPLNNLQGTGGSAKNLGVGSGAVFSIQYQF